MIQISDKIRIPLTDIFPGGSSGGEAHDWTPSLFSNEQNILTKLCNTIGVQIKPIAQEYIVWNKLRIDILAENIDTCNKVIIENQFGSADDSHLSRILKYFIGLKNGGDIVDTIIWIVEECDDSVISVFNDLNERYSETNFFIVQMIGEKDINSSAKYIEYNIIVKPNNFNKIIHNTNSLNENEVTFAKWWEFFKSNIINNEYLSKLININFNTVRGWKSWPSKFAPGEYISITITKTSYTRISYHINYENINENNIQYKTIVYIT